MSLEKYYAVQVLPEDPSLAAKMTSVPAKGPMEAARIVLGDDFSVHGAPNDLKVRVWELRDDFTTNCLEFYRKTKAQPIDAQSKRSSLISVNLWIGVVAIVVVGASVAAILSWGAAS